MSYTFQSMTCPNCGNSENFLVKTLQMHLLRAEIASPAALGDDWRWIPLAQLNSVGLPAPVKLALETLVQPSLI